MFCVRPGTVSRGAPESPGQDRQVAADPRRQADQVLSPQLRQARPLQTQAGRQWKETCLEAVVESSPLSQSLSELKTTDATTKPVTADCQT